MCAIFGIYGHPEAANLTYLALYAMQHRGQEGSGITASDGSGEFKTHKAMGYVADISETDLVKLAGNLAIGHNRYSTCGESRTLELQPFEAHCAHGHIAIAHNGNLTNYLALHNQLEDLGSVVVSSSDTEIIQHLYARAHAQTPIDALRQALSRIEGAYSLVILIKDRSGEQCLVGVRDPRGFRPLSLGKLGESWVLASETCAFDLLGASYVRDIEPGEIVVIDQTGLKSFQTSKEVTPAPCVFEEVYFARPDSYVYGGNVLQRRLAMGRQLAREHPADADVVVPVLDSGLGVAQGFSEESKIPMRYGLIRNHYVGRTFIRPAQSLREVGVRIKHNACREIVAGKRLVLLDDSIVRGTSSRKIVKLLRDAGATEIHFRISGPPTVSPCTYGIDTPRKEELIAASSTIEEIRKFLDVDSLGYLSLEGLLSAVGNQPRCSACYTREYPTKFSFNEVPFERRRNQ